MLETCPDAKGGQQLTIAFRNMVKARNVQAFDEWLAQEPPASRDVVFQALDSLVTPPVIEKQSQMQDAVNLLLEQAKNGSITPQEALDQAKIEIEALLQ